MMVSRGDKAERSSLVSVKGPERKIGTLKHNDPVKRSGFILIALALGCLNSRGQMNNPPSPPPAFSLPSPQLRSPVKPEPLTDDSFDEGNGPSSSPFEPDRVGPDQTLSLRTNDSTQPTSVSRPGILDSRTYQYLDENGYLTRPGPKSDNRFVRFLSSTFEPEVFPIFKAPATCSIYTAIQRKNPLCLLNPLVFSVSW